jgi:hypothetical protein
LAGLLAKVAKFVACPGGMFGVNDEPANGMNQTGIIASLGKRLAGIGVKPNERARLMYRLAQQQKPRFLDGARICDLRKITFLLRIWAGRAIYREFSCGAGQANIIPGPGPTRPGFGCLGHGSPRLRRFNSGRGFPCIDVGALEIQPFVYDAGPWES